ncbi:MAG: YggS family pyridoxal phosphate-dependent enzyme [Candidatus Anammoxibacter sp.]
MTKSKELIKQNLEVLYKRIEAASLRSGRNPESVKLVVSTKYIDTPITRILLENGLNEFGENRLQDTEEKISQLGEETVSWHMFGHLQRNKVKKAIKIFDLIHSVESLRLAKEINKESVKLEKRTKILVEVNISGEETKYGLSPEETIPFMKELNVMEGLEVEGLMTMAPMVADQEICRPIFKGLKEFSDKIEEMGLENIKMKYLSMGMTLDFEAAIEEGSNLIRVGTAIFKGIDMDFRYNLTDPQKRSEYSAR